MDQLKRGRIRRGWGNEYDTYKIQRGYGNDDKEENIEIFSPKGKLTIIETKMVIFIRKFAMVVINNPPFPSDFLSRYSPNPIYLEKCVKCGFFT